MATLVQPSAFGGGRFASLNRRKEAPANFTKGAFVSMARSRRRAKLIVCASPTEIRPLVGSRAPGFEAEAVINQQFQKVKLSNYTGKNVVLFFYPLNFTFVCPSELTALSDRYGDFKKNDCEVLAVSTDSVFSHLAWIQTDRNSGGLGNINYPLVSDMTKGIGLRGLFIIDKEGIIQYKSVNNLAIGRNVDESLRILEAIQHVKAHPDEICPTGWQPGDAGIKPKTKNYSPI